MSKLDQQKPKYVFDEIVKIINPKYNNVLNKQGYIAGMVINDYGIWYYGVCLFQDQEVWHFYEEDLISTGQFVPEGFGMSGETIRVVVNEKGEGSIKEDD